MHEGSPNLAKYFDEARVQGIEANAAKFRNEFRDMYDRAFPLSLRIWFEKRVNYTTKSYKAVWAKMILKDYEQ